MERERTEVMTRETEVVVIHQQAQIETLEHEVQSLRKEVSELQKDLEFLDGFQEKFNKKRGEFIVELVGTIGGLIIAGIVIVGIFFN